jgi:hypothetical protein
LRIGKSQKRESFCAGFWYLDELSQLARLGVDVMCRQQISAEGYGLVDKEFNTHPDFFTSLLYKRLVGEVVLNTSIAITATVASSGGEATGATASRQLQQQLQREEEQQPEEEVAALSGLVRVYAHCARHSNSSSAAVGSSSGTSGIALVFLNMMPSAVSIRLPAALAGATRDEFHLTAPVDEGLRYDMINRSIERERESMDGSVSQKI